MKEYSRRQAMNLTLIGCTTLGAMSCSQNLVQKSGSDIENAAESTLQNLFDIIPESRTIYEKSVGTLIMPTITKASFMFGGAYGEGVLKIGGANVDFYSVASASFGYQLGAQQFSHVIFFMTQESLRHFRTIDGWEVGADAEVTFRSRGSTYGVSSNTISKPVYAIVFGQRGLIAGASLEGAKYSRLIRG